MKKLFLIAGSLVLLLSACDNSPGMENTPVATAKDSLSYTLGVRMGQTISTTKDDIDVNALMRGITDAMDEKGILSDEQLQEHTTRFQRTMQERENSRRKEEIATNIEVGKAFLAGNKSKEGVVELPSGLQYKVLTRGTGRSPRATETVVAHYRGTLIDGTQFDSSYDRGEPSEFPVNRVIAGWTEALQLMKEGGKWELYIPENLAYGANGRGKIPSGATLLFTVELVKVK